MMEKASKREYLFLILLPISFVLLPILTFVTYYLHIEGAMRKYGVISIEFALFLYFSIILIIEIKKGVFTKNELRVFFIPIIVYTICFVYSIISFNLNPLVIENSIKFLLMGVPAYTTGILCYKYNLQKKFLLNLERWGLIALPAAIIYISRMFLFSSSSKFNELISLGTHNYMNVAYSFLPFLLASLVLLSNSEISFILVRKYKASNFLRICNIILLFTAITFTATRGPILCVLFLGLMILVVSIVKRSNFVKAALISALLFTIFLLSVFVVLPTLFETSNRIISTFDMEQYEIAEGFDEYGDAIISSDVNLIRELANTEEYKNGEIPLRMHRLTLARVAFSEMQDRNFIFGMGPMGFELKYQGYSPHNLVVQLIVELGIFGILFIAMIIILLFSAIFRVKNNYFKSAILLFIIGYIPYFMLSGSIWTNQMLVFAIGYSIFQLKCFDKGDDNNSRTYLDNKLNSSEYM